MFRLQLPLSDVSWLKEYSSVWLDGKINFYGWFVPKWYQEKHWKFTKVNARGNGASFSSVESLQNAISIIQSEGNLFSYVCNAANVSSKESSIEDNIKIVNSSITPNSVILTDLLLCDKIHKKIKIHVSSFVSLYNSFSIDFLVKNHKDISRIIFPRDILIHDIEKIRENHKNLEFEIFIKNSWCYHSSHCTSHHLDYKTFLCNREQGIIQSKWIITSEKIKQLQTTKLHCKACSLFKLKEQFGKKSKTKMYLKIPWREMRIEDLVKDAKFVNEAIKNCEKAKSMKQTLSLNILTHRKIYGKYCDYKNCEYFLIHKDNV